VKLALRSRLDLLAAAAIFSTGGAAIKATTLTGWQVASFRSGIAALTVLALVPAARRGWSWRTLVVGAIYAATLILFVVANKLTTSANAIFLQATAPLYLLLLGPWLLKEPIHRRDLGFVAAVGLGLACFFIGTEPPVRTAPDPVRGNVVATLSGVCWAFSLIGLRWLGSVSHSTGKEAAAESSPAVAAVAAGNLIACGIALPAALPVIGATPVDWATLLYLGAVQIGLAYMLLTRGIRHVPALEASLLLMLEPVLNPVWAWVIHGERPGVWALAGGVAILGATLVKTWVDARSTGPAALPEPYRIAAE
jgi:drug/metabolite transporter (DMT)-like permease